jgi:hypothetical protein
MRIISAVLLTVTTLTLAGCAFQRAQLAEFREKLRNEKVTAGGERSVEYVNLLTDKELEIRIGDDPIAVAVLKPRDLSVLLEDQKDNRYWFKQLWNDKGAVTFTVLMMSTNGPVCIAKHPFPHREGIMPNDQPEPYHYEIDERFIAKQHQPKGWFKKVAKK